MTNDDDVESFKIGTLVSLIATWPSDDNEVFCWYETMVDGKLHISSIYHDKDTMALYLGLWKKHNGVKWYKVLIGKQEYIVSKEQIKLYKHDE